MLRSCLLPGARGRKKIGTLRAIFGLEKANPDQKNSVKKYFSKPNLFMRGGHDLLHREIYWYLIKVRRPMAKNPAPPLVQLAENPTFPFLEMHPKSQKGRMKLSERPNMEMGKMDKG